MTFSLQDLSQVGDKVYTWQILYTISKSTMFCWASSLTATLGVVRCLAIQRPFLRPNKPFVLSVAVGLGVFTVVGNIIRTQTEELRWNAYTQRLFDVLVLRVISVMLTTKYFLNVMISMGSAVWSTQGLKRSEKMGKQAGASGKQSKDACITIICLNVMIFLQFLVFVVSLVIQYAFKEDVVPLHYSQFLQMTVSNTLLSALNPLVYITRSSKMRDMLFGSRRRAAVGSTSAQIISSELTTMRG